MKTGIQIIAVIMFAGLSQGMGANYSLDLSSVSQRQRMQDWDPAWISEVEDWFQGYEFQVDPGNGGQVGVWGGTPGNNVDYSQFIAAGPAAGQPIRVRIKYQHQFSGVWASCSHGNDSNDRHHYEVSMQGGQLRIYKFWGPTADDYDTILAVPYGPTPGATYWIYLIATRANNSPIGHITITGELWNEDLTSKLVSVSGTDDGTWGGQPVITDSNRRGFGGYFPPDGTGAKIFEWHVEALTTPLDYSAWQAQAFPQESPADDRLKQADPDRDGLRNAIEFYLGLDPLVSDPQPMQLRITAGNLVVSYSRKIGRVVNLAEVQHSMDFSGWSAAGGIETIVNSDGDFDEVEVTFPLDDMGFVRFAVDP